MCRANATELFRWSRLESQRCAGRLFVFNVIKFAKLKSPFNPHTKARLSSHTNEAHPSHSEDTSWSTNCKYECVSIISTASSKLEMVSSCCTNDAFVASEDKRIEPLTQRAKPGLASVNGKTTSCGRLADVHGKGRRLHFHTYN